VRDITQRKDAEAQQQVLSGELQHRIKNTLAMVSAIATQTLRGDDIAERRDAFTARIGVLARAHDLLLTTTWTSAPLREVVERAIEAHRSERRGITLSGPDIVLNPRQALSVALSVHELATNSLKYGALSVDGGAVTIAWSREPPEAAGNPRFEFRWEERGGPPVTPPTRKGFGSRLITKVLPADFAGEIRIDYLTSGVVCVMTAPAGNVTTMAEQDATAQSTGV
jgi:two-component sensor histidine kinase